ncbi:MAG: hypothetical protein QF570_19325 [Myxococcota bacterium]|jgi:hypothetical protein|nr:hypothetical protein [Myxococcota bacterium]
MNSVLEAEASNEAETFASAPAESGTRGPAAADLDALDRRHLERVLCLERMLPAFLWGNLTIAAGLIVYYSWSQSWSGLRAVVVLLILLSARGHLRQLRSARLLRKLVGTGADRC